MLCLVQDNGQIYEALKTIAACYLRADTASICDCLSAFGLNDLLFDLSRHDLSRQVASLSRMLPPHRLPHTPFPSTSLKPASACG